ncbi:MAG: hypothetical protein LUE89_00210 [Clostridiales bacterium]|nr:hypothetical protein [Clostridiales bacterium]
MEADALFFCPAAHVRPTQTDGRTKNIRQHSRTRSAFSCFYWETGGFHAKNRRFLREEPMVLVCRIHKKRWYKAYFIQNKNPLGFRKPRKADKEKDKEKDRDIKIERKRKKKENDSDSGANSIQYNTIFYGRLPFCAAVFSCEKGG